MKTSYKWIKFVKIATTSVKTSMWECRHHDNTLLGEVKWYSFWRQYCFFPDYDMVFSKGCMDDICNFMVELRKEELETRKKKVT